MLSKYEMATEWLFQQFPSYQKIGASAFKPTLENTKKLIEALELKPEELNFVHIAGSNGKGTTAAIIASSLTESGYKTGLFTSPHIKDFSERIRINGKIIDRESVIQFVDRLRNLNLDFEPSFFEISFTMALHYFLNERCDICVIETGLGGRLDATNVIQPQLSVITTISLEHTNFLGNTLEDIAKEKGGIIKENIAVVIGEGAQEQLAVFNSIAKNKEAEVVCVEPGISIIQYSLPFLNTSYQIENFRTALTALHLLSNKFTNISELSIQQGLNELTGNTGYLGRLQKVSENPLIIYDASHNTDGIKATIRTVLTIPHRKLRIIYGTSADKDIESIVGVLPENACYYVTEFQNSRSAKIEALKIQFSGKNTVSINYFETPEMALQTAKNESSEHDIILVIGSFFLLEHFF